MGFARCILKFGDYFSTSKVGLNDLHFLYMDLFLQCLVRIVNVVICCAPLNFPIFQLDIFSIRASAKEEQKNAVLKLFLLHHFVMLMTGLKNKHIPNPRSKVLFQRKCFVSVN